MCSLLLSSVERHSSTPLRHIQLLQLSLNNSKHCTNPSSSSSSFFFFFSVRRVTTNAVYNDKPPNKPSNKGETTQPPNVLHFRALGLKSRTVLNYIKTQKFESPTTIQKEAVPLISGGRDVILDSATGTGKTLAYLLPLLDPLLHDIEMHAPHDPGPRLSSTWTAGAVRVLIVTPTRELSFQVRAVIDDILLSSSAFISESERSAVSQVLLPETSEPFERQSSRLHENVPYILLSTPKSFIGMLATTVEKRRSDVVVEAKRLSAVVVDEVDETLKGKSRYERKKTHEHKKPGEILSYLLQDVYRKHNRNFQLIIASATVNRHARKLASRIQGSHREIEVIKRRTDEGVIPKGIQHYVTLINTSNKERADAVHKVITKFSAKSTLVFVGRGYPIKEFVTLLNSISPTKAKAQALHEAMIPQRDSSDRKLEDISLERKKLVDQFKSGEISILVTTDKSCRGLDFGVDDPLVILCDAPEDASEYVHLAGRTGRRGGSGVCVSLYTEHTYAKLPTMMSHLPSVQFEPIELYDKQQGLNSWRIESFEASIQTKKEDIRLSIINNQ